MNSYSSCCVQDGRLELWLGNDCKAPDNEEEGAQRLHTCIFLHGLSECLSVADGKTASELALVKAGVWMHALRQAATRSYSVSCVVEPDAFPSLEPPRWWSRSNTAPSLHTCRTRERGYAQMSTM